MPHQSKIILGETVWGGGGGNREGVYRNTLYLLLNFSVNLNLENKDY